MNARDARFIDTVLTHFKGHGRHNLPWRKTAHPYRIVVSELMLQQTQVERVIPKYKAFLKEFPNVRKLSEASLGDVLRLWQGLGYNRRAGYLHEMARVVVGELKGRFPKSKEGLLKLPGIGPYTAGAVLAFSYNQAVPLIETNIRTVYLHSFFKNKENIDDREVLKLLERHLPAVEPREWYAALMDYGTHIKTIYGNPNKRSKHYTKQSPLKGSKREVRGAIIRALTEVEMSKKILIAELDFEEQRIITELDALMNEGMIEQKSLLYRLPV